MAEEYDLILADPPWHYQNYSGDEPGKMHNRSRGAAKHYPTMSIEDIMGLPVKPLAAKDSVLLLWVTWPTILDAFRTIEAWGFVYKTDAWVWIKANKTGWGFFMGNGYLSRKNTEPCLIATRGDGLPQIAKNVLDIIYSPVREHSRKPDEQYGKIDRLFGTSLRKLELFARRKQPGWDVWGNEVESSISLGESGNVKA